MPDRADDGGPAFPHAATFVQPDNDRAHVIPAQAGMSLRDWFAGQALAGLLANSSGPVLEAALGGAGYITAAYEFADAMLKQRES